MSFDNIIIGEPLVSLELLGLLSEEKTIHVDVQTFKNEDGEIFLPAILKHLGLFKSTGEIKKINQQRIKNPKFKSDPNQSLWRTLKHPEFTQFKVGKRVFCLIVGEF